MAKVLLNGRLTDEASAAVSVEDRGLRFGDGVFETIPVHGGAPYLFEYHLERLNAGLVALRISFDTAPLIKQAAELIRENGVREGLLRIMITRGSGSRGYLPIGEGPATLVMQTLARPELSAGRPALWLSSYEKTSPRALPSACKLAQGVSSTLARMEAADHGCAEALMLAGDGSIAEASGANLFWLRGGTLYTPSPDTGALCGVTRRRMIELSPHPVKEGRYPLSDLQRAEAVVMTNAVLGVLPVHALKPRGWGWESGALAEELSALRRADIVRGAGGGVN